MKLPTLIGTNVEEFGLYFLTVFRRQNYLIVIPLDYLLRTDAVKNYNAALNYCEEKIQFCAKLQVQDFNDYAETLHNIVSNMSAHLGRAEILCLAIPGIIMGASVILIFRDI